MLASGFMAVQWHHWYAGSIPPVIILPPPLPAPGFAPFAGKVYRPDGLPETIREPIMTAIAFGKFHMDPGQIALLDDLLGEDGAKILPHQSSDDAITPTKAGVQRRWDMALKIKTPTGEIQFKPFSAEFGSPDQNNWVAVRADDVVSFATQSGIVDSFSVTCIDHSLGELRDEVPSVTPMQLAFVAKAMMGKTWPHNATHPRDFLPPSTLPATKLTGNVLRFGVNRTYYLVLPDGRGIDETRCPGGLDPVTGIPMPTPVNFVPLMPGDHHLMGWLSVYCLAVVVLAIYLVGSGITTLIRPASWAKLHLPYAIAKLILIAIEVALSIAFIASASAFSGRSTMKYNANAGTQGVLITAIIQAAYPLTLLAIYFLQLIPGAGVGSSDRQEQ